MSENLNLKTITTIDPSPFKHLCVTIGELPSTFVESMSYYECLAWLVSYLENTVIPAVNQNGEACAELQAAFIELKTFVDDYFDNLDVQEEINNKLDEMAEEGTLQEIITTYIQSNVAWTFDTVADMKLATNLVAGSYTRTLGFHSLNDGGGALYYITNSGTANEMDVIAVDTLYANLVKPIILTPEMLGATGTGDETLILQRAFAISKNIRFGNDYTITNRIDILSGTTFDGAYHTVTNNTAVNFFRATNQSGITIKNINLIGDDTLSMAQNGINIISCSDVVVENVNVKDTGGDGVSFASSTQCILRNAKLDNNLISALGYNSNKIIFENVHVYKPRFQFGIQFKSCQHSIMRNIFVDTSQDNSVYISKGAEEESQLSYDITAENITVLNQGAEGTQGSGDQYSIIIAGVDDCKLDGAYIKSGLKGIGIINSPRAIINNITIADTPHGIRSLSDDVIISNCEIKNGYEFGIRVEGAKNNIIKGCRITNCGHDTGSGNIELISTDGCIVDSNILEITNDAEYSKVNICTKTAVGKLTVTNNNFINPATGNSYFDLGTVLDVDKLTLGNNGWIRIRNFQGVTLFPGVIEVKYGFIEIRTPSVTTTPTYSGFKDGSVIYNGSGEGYIGWVIKSGVWHTFGAISS